MTRSSTSTSGSRESLRHSYGACRVPGSSCLTLVALFLIVRPIVICCSTLASNIRTRRGGKVAINVPIFHDTNTPRPFIDPSIPYDRDLYPGDSEAKDGAALPDHIYMDAMAFGMGCCCLQITFQASDQIGRASCRERV